MALFAEHWLSNDTNPKHLLKLVILSIKTLADTILPNTENS